MIFPLHRLATSSSLEHKNYLTPQVCLYTFLFISFFCAYKKEQPWFSASLSIHVVAGFLEAVLKEDVATMSVPSWGGRRHKIWL
jgi:hypothetical protein